MTSKSVTIKGSVGLHDRVTPLFVQKANTYSCTVWVEKDERRLNAKSLLGVLSMALEAGTTVNIIADGENEEKAVEVLSTLISEGFIAD